MRELPLIGTFLLFGKFDAISPNTVVRCYYRQLGSQEPFNTGSIYLCKKLMSSASLASRWFSQVSQHVRKAVMEPQPAFRLTRNALLAAQSLVRLSQKHSTKISQLAQLSAVPAALCVTTSAFAQNLTDPTDQNELNQSGARYPRTTQPTGNIICPSLLLSEPSSAQPRLRAAPRTFSQQTLIVQSLVQQALPPSQKLPIRTKAPSTKLQLLAVPQALFVTTSGFASNYFSSSFFTSNIPAVTASKRRFRFLSTVRGHQAADGFFMSFRPRITHVQ